MALFNALSEDMADEKKLEFTLYFYSILKHIEDLRFRLFRIIIILSVSTGLCLFFSEYLIKILTSRFMAEKQPYLALLYPTEGFVVRLKIAFVSGLFLSSPIWFWQVWGFISPGLYQREKRIVIPVILASSGAFVIGAAFGLWILPHAVQYFWSLAPTDVTVSWSLGKYLDFALRMLIAFALVFELPLIIYAATMLGVVTTKQLRKYRRHAYVGVLIAAAIITPPDLFTQIILALPLIVLYEFGILMAFFAMKKSIKADS